MSFDINAYFIKANLNGEMDGPYYPTVVCQDGFTMSVQASSFHYCSPRKDNYTAYNTVEVGFPSYHEFLLEPYIEVPGSIHSESVFGYVPVDIVNRIVEKHGGLYQESNE